MNTYKIGEEYIQTHKTRYQVVDAWLYWKQQTKPDTDNPMVYSWFVDWLVQRRDAVRLKIEAETLTYQLH